jgi:hypothetical protein
VAGRRARAATYVVEDDQRSVDAADGVVPYPRLDRHHAGVEVRHGGGRVRQIGGSAVPLVAGGRLGSATAEVVAGR